MEIGAGMTLVDARIIESLNLGKIYPSFRPSFITFNDFLLNVSQ